MIQHFFINNIFRKGLRMADQVIFGGVSHIARTLIMGIGKILWYGLQWFFGDDPQEANPEAIVNEGDVIHPRIVYGSRWIDARLVHLLRYGGYRTKELLAAYLIVNNEIVDIEPEIVAKVNKKHVKINVKSSSMQDHKIITHRTSSVKGHLVQVDVVTGDWDLLEKFPHLRYQDKTYDYVGKSLASSYGYGHGTFLMCRFAFDRDMTDFDPQNLILPQISVKSKNTILFDPRKNEYVVSNNNALCLYHFLLHVLKLPSTMINIESIINAANICDERYVTTDTGTVQLHTCDALISLEDNPTHNLSYLLQNMLGDMYMEDGQICIRAGSAYKVLDYTHVINKNLCGNGVSFDIVSPDVVESSFVIHASYVNSDNQLIKLKPLLVDLKSIAPKVEDVDFYTPPSGNLKSTDNEYQADYNQHCPDMRTSSYNLDKYQINLSDDIPAVKKWFKPKMRYVDVQHFHLSLPFASNENQARMLSYYYARTLLFKKYRFYIDVSIDEYKFAFHYAYKIRLPFFSKAYNFIIESRNFDIKNQTMRLTFQIDYEGIWSAFDKYRLQDMIRFQEDHYYVSLSMLFGSELNEVMEILTLNRDNKKSVYGYQEYFYYTDTLPTDEQSLAGVIKSQVLDKEVKEIRKFLDLDSDDDDQD